MNLTEFSIEEFAGMIFFYPFLIYFIFVCFDGIGVFKDIFERGRTRRRTRRR